MRYDRPMRIASAVVMLALSGCATTHARGAYTGASSQPVNLMAPALAKVPTRFHAELAKAPPILGVPSAWHLHGPGALDDAMLARINQLTHAVVQVAPKDLSSDASTTEAADEGWWIDLQVDSAALPHLLASPQITLAIPAHAYVPFDICRSGLGAPKCDGYTAGTLREALKVGATPVVGGLAKIEGCIDPSRTETLARLGVLLSSVIADKQCGYTIIGVGMPARWVNDFVALPWVTSFEMSPPLQLDGKSSTAMHDTE